MKDDAQLLSAYATHHSEEAFAALVQRHISLVYSSALRQTRNPHLAEEITQTVFIILARKAGQLRRETVLAGWLCRTARFAACNLLKAENRRQHREHEAHMNALLNEPEPDVWPKIAPLLDEAVAQLAEADRNAMILRFYEQRSLDEVGRVLGLNADAAQKRVSRALDKLRKFFTRRGVVLTTALIAGAIAANSVQAAPAALANSTVAVALGKSASVSASTATLLKTTLKLMACTKAKTTILISAAVILAATIPPLVKKAVREVEDYGKAQMRTEMRVAEAKVRDRQQTDDTEGAATINLKPFLNTKLTDSPSSPKNIKANNLTELPLGTNLYAGVPFDVEGTIQLMGNNFKKYGKTYPVQVEKIPIGRPCAKIHLLHGESNIPWEQSGMPVAKLILHYASGSDEEFNLVAGAQAFDFWGPSKSYGLAGKPQIKPAPGTELAWVGTNPWVQKWVPQFRIRLYRTTFPNPRPAEVITSFDYVSTLAENTAPFLVAMTVE